MLKKFVRSVDAVNSFVGRYTALLLIPLVFVVFYEVVMRKLFNAPTTWAFEMTVYFYGFHFMMSMGVTFLHDKHVRIDIITMQLPVKAQLVLRLVTFWVIFLPFIGAFLWAGTEYAASSWMQWEHSWSAWKPPLYPYKTVIPVSMFLLLIQGFANFIREWYQLKGEKI
jgi:TRAP-type mannitol/chloroaromatic compound transport system permease small subunit